MRADPATVRSAIDGSLQRLGVDTIDLYSLHHRSEDTPIEDTVGAMADLVRSGKIRAIGLSNVTVEDLRRAHAVYPIQAVQEERSLGERGVELMLPLLAELGVTLVAHSPLAHGALHAAPALSVTRAAISSPCAASGTPNTAASATAGWAYTSSISRG